MLVISITVIFFCRFFTLITLQALETLLTPR